MFYRLLNGRNTSLAEAYCQFHATVGFFLNHFLVRKLTYLFLIALLLMGIFRNFIGSAATTTEAWFLIIGVILSVGALATFVLDLGSLSLSLCVCVRACVCVFSFCCLSFPAF